MGSNVVSVEMLGLIATIVLGAIGLWIRIDGSMLNIRREVNDRCDKTDRAVQDLREMVIRDYATATHIEKVEGKLAVAIDKLIEEVKLLRDDLVSTRAQPIKRTTGKT
jgi:hypothetical protein